MNIDLDAARKARMAAQDEQTLEPKTITFGGQVFQLPVEMPYEAAEAITLGRHSTAINSLLGPDQFEKFWSFRPTVPDMTALLDQLADVYGFPSLGDTARLGELLASGGSSSEDGKP